MELALQLAHKGVGRTHPNPMVGCVIVKDGKIVGQGYHARAGRAHAEIRALKSAGIEAKGADVYVTLEPCDHHGRTKPCTEALIAAGVKRVFSAIRDPHQIVNGRGFKSLRRAGIQVEVGLLGQECADLNEAFTHFVHTGRPFVMAKMAQSLDGRVATRTRQSKWITGEKSRKFGQGLRHQADAIVVGVETVLADDPQLTCRIPAGVDPIRVVLDCKARTPTVSKIVGVAKYSKSPTLVVVGNRVPKQKIQALEVAGAEVLRCKSAKGKIDLPQLLEHLAQRDILSLLVEGGPTVIGSFFEHGLVNKVFAFVAPMVIGGRSALGSVGGLGPATLNQAHFLKRTTVQPLGNDFLITGYC